MKRKVLLSAVLCLCLTACQDKAPPVTPTPIPAPEVTAEVEEPLSAQVIDETHDAFLVNTGGSRGMLLVTVEWNENDKTALFQVWDPVDRDTPLQTMEKGEVTSFHTHEVTDANFDGYLDFGYQYFMGNQPTYWYYWIWNEETGRFEEEPAFTQISMPQFDPAEETVTGWARSSGAGTGESTIYQWVDGALTCVRRIEVELHQTHLQAPNYVMTVEERLGEAFLMVDRQEFTGPRELWDETEEEESFFDARARWERLDYQGEPEGFYSRFANRFWDIPCRGFLMDTKGAYGMRLVTVEQDPDSETALFSVWDPQDLSVPVQTISDTALAYRTYGDGWEWVEDANFDGYTDMGYLFELDEETYAQSYHVWLWNEEKGLFDQKTQAEVHY